MIYEFFTMGVIKHWNTETMDMPSQEVALSNLVYRKVSLPMAGGL